MGDYSYWSPSDPPGTEQGRVLTVDESDIIRTLLAPRQSLSDPPNTLLPIVLGLALDDPDIRRGEQTIRLFDHEQNRRNDERRQLYPRDVATATASIIFSNDPDVEEAMVMGSLRWRAAPSRSETPPWRGDFIRMLLEFTDQELAEWMEPFLRGYLGQLCDAGLPATLHQAHSYGRLQRDWDYLHAQTVRYRSSRLSRSDRVFDPTAFARARRLVILGRTRATANQYHDPRLTIDFNNSDGEENNSTEARWRAGGARLSNENFRERQANSFGFIDTDTEPSLGPSWRQNSMARPPTPEPTAQGPLMPQPEVAARPRPSRRSLLSIFRRQQRGVIQQLDTPAAAPGTVLAGPFTPNVGYLASDEIGPPEDSVRIISSSTGQLRGGRAEAESMDRETPN
ncbi:hypothetical protein DRE_04153 [Drechslerella stenobrocha 248]|uniref:Uncharacterized protein n=1 Tax=Drechslerella stenobrocha 248 TaxID=1043628 RepID=W7HRJ9_9PEZI|nr:hypothetical protein DRE_04153 [Drechslerella stenobrocha 248]